MQYIVDPLETTPLVGSVNELWLQCIQSTPDIPPFDSLKLRCYTLPRLQDLVVVTLCDEYS
jgi:hypothetical protein